jgi:UDP-2-acetamido-3-amino-2,3-dideoxy-glucuronate N-acetyltransferase
MTTSPADGTPPVRDGDPPYIHPTAIVEAGSRIGAGCRVWANVQIRPGAKVGRNCTLGRNSFVDVDVHVGDNVKIQNNASLFEGVRLEDGVFIGPHVVFTNDRVPRAVNPDGSFKSTEDWCVGHTTVARGAALGACAVVVTGVSIGAWAMIGAGTVVSKDVPDYALVVGNPGRVIGWVSAAGARFPTQDEARRASEGEAAAGAAGRSS